MAMVLGTDKKFTIVVTDDDADTLKVMTAFLDRQEYEILPANSGRRTLQILSTRPVQLVVTDLMMPSMDGVALTKEIKKLHPDLPVVMVTGFGSVETAVEAMKAGACDYITKPVLPEELNIKVARALEQYSMRAEIQQLRQQVSKASRGAHVLVGESPAIKKVMDLVSLVAKREVPVLLQGESGTGKELVARAIHEGSARKKGPFVPLNCGALPETLLESELFGYEKGAFTGAGSGKKGLFEEAHGGTLFLDEVADAPIPMQVKLLRALQEGEIRRLGSTRTVDVDVRVISSANKRIEEEVAGGRFREDLYFRLAVVTITLPPLRERKEDITLLAEHFIHKYREPINQAIRGISPDAWKALLEYSWPGNVRELEYLIRRGMVLSDSEWLTGEHLSFQPRAENAVKSEKGKLAGADLTLAQAESDFLKSYFSALMAKNRGKIQAVASQAGISRKNVYEHLKRLDLSPDDFR